MTEEAHRLIKTVRDMEASLEDDKRNHSYGSDNDGDFKVTYPLTRCLQGLKEKYSMVAKIHRERFEQVRSTYYIPTFW
jgi:protein regulator of cytokinesis 1